MNSKVDRTDKNRNKNEIENKQSLISQPTIFKSLSGNFMSNEEEKKEVEDPYRCCIDQAYIHNKINIAQ